MIGEQLASALDVRSRDIDRAINDLESSVERNHSKDLGEYEAYSETRRSLSVIIQS